MSNVDLCKKYMDRIEDANFTDNEQDIICGTGNNHWAGIECAILGSSVNDIQKVR